MTKIGELRELGVADLERRESELVYGKIELDQPRPHREDAREARSGGCRSMETGRSTGI